MSPAPAGRRRPPGRAGPHACPRRSRSSLWSQHRVRRALARCSSLARSSGTSYSRWSPFLVCLWRTPNTYPKGGVRRGTATQNPRDPGQPQMLMRTDPFRELDRLTQQVLGTTTRPAIMPMDAWRDGDEFIVEFDLPGVKAEDVDLDVERSMLTVKAERPVSVGTDRKSVAAERPRGVFSRQLFLGDNLDTDRVQAEFDAGVLRLTIPVAEKAVDHSSRRKGQVTQDRDRQQRQAPPREVMTRS